MNRIHFPARRTLVAAALATGLAGIGGPALAADHTMRISHQFPPTHHTALNLAQFEKDVEAATQGKV
ncbi:hypothetical protein, partial [Ramlibacter sp.]|uniref:hypothetical protein n=1 Tax=Ramlibacter sp. TaxID=1917967 RepID=UPI002FC5A8D9